MFRLLPETAEPQHPDIGAAFASFTTKQNVSPVPLPVLSAGRLIRGSRLNVKAFGYFSTTGTPTIQFGFWIGTRALAASSDLALSSAITTGSGAAAWPWIMEWEGIVTAAESTAGSLTGMGYLLLGTSLTAFAAAVPIPTTDALRTVAFDPTIERAIGVNAAFSANSASNIVKVHSLTVTPQNC